MCPPTPLPPPAVPTTHKGQGTHTVPDCLVIKVCPCNEHLENVVTHVIPPRGGVVTQSSSRCLGLPHQTGGSVRRPHWFGSGPQVTALSQREHPASTTLPGHPLGAYVWLREGGLQALLRDLQARHKGAALHQPGRRRALAWYLCTPDLSTIGGRHSWTHNYDSTEKGQLGV